MNLRASFALRGRNPDVLTCIANLSNDEVFTPPELANRMLDTLAETWAVKYNGSNIWADSTVKFLDPCTKSGVFLRQIAQRLTKGLSTEIPNLEERVDHILTKQVFGIATSRLTSLLARRSVYCSKSANGEHSIVKSFDSEAGNIWYERTEHSWVHGKCSFCGARADAYDRGREFETYAYTFIHAEDVAAQVSSIFGGEMQFDVIVGNPPYQLGQSGGDAVGGFATPIYQKFIQTAKSLEPRYVLMVTPSRWFAGGVGLNSFRNEMLDDTRIRALVDYPDATEVFPGTQIKGGVSYFLWDYSWNDTCEVTTIYRGEPTTKPMKRFLGSYDVVVRRNEAIPILEKVLARNESDGVGKISNKVSASRPFGLRTYVEGAKTVRGIKNPLRLIGNGGESYIDRSSVEKKHEWIDQWKVLLGSAYGAGDTYPHQIYNHPIVAGPNTACTETYLVIDRFDEEAKAKNFAGYLRTSFVRFLVSLRKNTQHIIGERFQFVPDLPMDIVWTDDLLYKKYDITRNEIAYIDSMIRPMIESDE